MPREKQRRHGGLRYGAELSAAKPSRAKDGLYPRHERERQLDGRDVRCAIRQSGSGGSGFFGLATRLSVGQPLAGDAFDRECGPRCVIETERDPIVIAEVEFAEIPLQVLLAYVMIHPVHPALEN